MTTDELIVDLKRFPDKTPVFADVPTDKGLDMVLRHVLDATIRPDDAWAGRFILVCGAIAEPTTTP